MKLPSGGGGSKILQKASSLEETGHIKRGGLTLIRSRLSNMPIYLMSLFRLPKGVNSRLEKIQWISMGGGTSRRKIYLVNWRIICSSKDKGSLDIRRLTLMNRSLQGKWSSRFAEEENSAWKRVISHK